MSFLINRSTNRLKVFLGHLRMYSSAAEPSVIFETKGSTGIITLNRPKALNSLNLEMIRLIYPQMKAWEETMSLVIMKGAGNKAFCAGGDVIAVTEAGKKGESLSEDFFREEYTLNNTIGTYRIPFIAMIDGITMGGGVGLSVNGEYRIATERTLFAMPETKIGLFPDVGGGHFLTRLGGRLGWYLALTGFRLKGRHVYRAGIATHYVTSEKLVKLEEELINLEKPTPDNIMNLVMYYHLGDDLNEEFVLRRQLGAINRLFAGNTVAKIMADLEADGTEWAMQQLATLKEMSPTSMCVTMRQLEEGSNMSLQDVLQMEYRLSQRCMADHDFYEGVRALLVDKDMTPKWNPSTVDDVTDEKLDWYFSSLGEKELVL